MTEPEPWRPTWERPPAQVGACQSTRSGGVSREPYASLNLGDHVGDDRARVNENRRRFARATGSSLDRVVLPGLVHGVAVRHVDREDCGTGVLEEPARFEADGLWTTDPTAVLWITVADCVPVFLADTRGTLVGLLHAGWRGVLDGILPGAVDQILRATAWPADRLTAAFGPAIGPCCFEVASDLAGRFARAFPTCRPSIQCGRPHLDLVQMLATQLQDLGIAPPSGSPPCTRCHPDRFFSHRAMGGRPTGRMVAAIWREHSDRG